MTEITNKNTKDEQQCLFEEKLSKKQARNNKKDKKQAYKLERKKQKEFEKQNGKKLKNKGKQQKFKFKKNKPVETSGEWFRLDNAATIYPAVVDKTWMFVYRISAVLVDHIKPSVLQKAVDDVLPRFPTFNVSIRHGLFWWYFEKRNTSVKIEQEHTFPCQPFEFGAGKSLIRFLYYNNRISFECFHALADGRGAMLLFNTLIRRYLELCGVKIEGFEGCLNFKDMPQAEEQEDAFFVYRNSGAKNKLKEKKAFKIKGDAEEACVINTLNVVMNTQNLKTVAKSFGAGIYAYLCACIAFSLYKRNKFAKKPIKISVPIDLRQFFESQTLRNFSSYINVEIATNGAEFEFEDVLEVFKQEFKKINKEYLLGNINANTAIQKNVFIKVLPRVVKDFVMKICFKKLGEDYQTLAFSNLGLVATPPEFAEYIERYEVNLGRNKYNNKSVGLVSFADTAVLTISSKIQDNTFERDLCRLIAKHGVEAVIESNRRDKYAR